MGYGARQGHATGIADRLHARALAVGDLAGSGLIAVSADVCLMAPGQARALRERIAKATGIPAAGVLVACTHTHSAPETGLAEALGGRPLPEHVPPMLDAIEAAAIEAWRRREPARLGWARGEARIGRNRRIESGPLDPSVDVLRVDAEDGRPLAVLFRHSCHGTVRGHDNLDISADWPGAAARAIEAETGAVAPFLLGAHADIDPRTRGLMDLAIPGQSVGLGDEAVRVLGREVADAALAAWRQAPTDATPQRVGVASAGVHLEVHPEAGLAARKRAAAEAVGVAPEALPRTSELFALASAAFRDLPVAEARSRIAQVRLYLRDKTAPFFVANRRELDVEVQVLRIGDAFLLALPLEPTTAVGLDWRARLGPDRRGLVVGIANGWLRYLPHASDLAHPLADQHYEVLQSTFTPGAAETLLEAGRKLAETLTAS
jgi:neutral ceramidase